MNRNLPFRTKIFQVIAGASRKSILNGLLFFSIFHATSLSVSAQQLPLCQGGETLAFSCQEACIVCDLNGYSNSTMQVMPGVPPPGFCTAVVHNIGWVGFIAGSVDLSFDVEVSPCTLGNSIEMGVYSAPNCTSFSLVSNCNTAMFQNTTYSFSNTQPLVPGCVYFLVFDNNGPAICPFTVTVTGGSATAPQPGPPPLPSGPTEICPGAVVTYAIPPVFGTCEYTWTAPPGSLINGLGSTLSISGEEGATVDITFGNVGGNICVETGNACADYNTACLPVTIATIPPTTLPPVSICNGTSLEWIDGTFYSSPQLLSVTFDSWLGCDSIVRQQLLIRPPITTNLGTILTCANACVEVGGSQYCATGFYQVPLTSWLGCDSTVIFSINQSPVDAVVAVPDTIDCLQSTVLLDGTGSTGSANYAWYNSQNTLLGTNITLPVSNTGTYLFVVERMAGALTCRDSAVVTVLGNVQYPQLTTEGDTINCDGDPVQINTVVSPAGLLFSWIGPGIDSTNQHLEDPWVNIQGNYILTATNPNNGCTGRDTALVASMGSVPNLTISGADTVNCFNPIVWLVANSTSQGVVFSWLAPDSTITIADSVLVNQNGLWVAQVVAPGGCSNLDTMLMLLDTLIPVVTATGAQLDCSGSPVAIQGSTSSPGATFSWTGPGNFTATIPDTTVTLAGAYILTVATANGCTASATANVLTNTDAPDLNANGWDTLTCGQTSIWVSASSMSPGAQLNWTGPAGFSATGDSVAITVPGNYTITATTPNGCHTSLNFFVPIDTVGPVVMAQGDTITCSNPLGRVIGFSSESSVQYFWTGPGVLDPNTSETGVTSGGLYILQVIGANGCPVYAQTIVETDDAAPQLAAVQSATLTCADTTVLLWASSSDNSVSFFWTGPNMITFNTDSVLVYDPGMYWVKATAANGCSDSLQLTVLADTLSPDLAAIGDMINCAQTSAQLVGQTMTSGVTFLWSGPNGFSSSIQSPTTTESGGYQLLGTGPNGCSSIAFTQVNADFTTPMLTVSSSIQTLTCLDTSAQLQVQSNLPGTGYQWTLMGAPIGNTASISGQLPGNYTVVGTASNGCTETNSITLNQDIAPPSAFATGDTLFCLSQNVTISGGSATSGATLQWSGPGNFSSTQNMPAVSLPGNYQLTVTAPNGCSATATATVFPDETAPDLSVQPAAMITCSNPITTLNAASNTAGTTFNWTGPGNFNAAGPVVQTPAAGQYFVQAVAANGCTTVQTITVATDTISPGATAIGGLLTCTDTLVVLTGSSNSLGVQYAWAGPGNFTSSQTNVPTGEPGAYSLTLTAPNGCTGTATAVVLENTIVPDLSLSGNMLLTCQQTTVNLTANSLTPDITWFWTGPGSFSASTPIVTVNLPGNYQSTITAPNGCTASAAITVNQNIVPPTVLATGGLITCASPSIVLLGQGGASYQWSGPGQFSATGPMPTANLAGNYTVTVTAVNGCTASTSATVMANQSPPAFALTGNTISCLSPTITAAASGFSTGTTFNWSGPGGFQQTGSLAAVSTPGSYQVTATGTNGCTAIQELSIPVDTVAPLIVLSGGMLSCRDSVAPIHAVVEPAGATLFWSGPQQNLPSSADIVVTLPGLYTMTATAANGCAAQGEVAIEAIAPNWTVDLGPDQTVWEGTWLTIQAETELHGQDVADITWVPAINCNNCLKQVFRAKDSVFLQVRIEDSNGCVMMDGVWINVRKRGEIYVPNVFSPDGDGFNDEFRVFAGNPATHVQSLRIFDRWGSQVFGQEDFFPDETRGFWDGRHRGSVLQPGVFVWMLAVEYEDGTREVLSGDVLLML